MVEVVEAMMTSGPTHLRGRRQHLALELDHFGHAFEHDAGAGERCRHICARTTETRAMTASASLVRQQAEPRQAGQRFLDFTERFGFERRELLWPSAA